MKSDRLRILQIGAGAMGMRRLRDLHQRDDVELAVFDHRPERNRDAQTRFGTRPFDTLEDAMAWEPAALVISTPPGTKRSFIDLAFNERCHHFSEADIWTYGAARRAAQVKGVVSSSSCTLKFLPVVKAVRNMVQTHVGSVLSYHHALGTYMPNWHAGEDDRYYGRHRDTAPAREMVCFELHFLNAIFGPALEVAGSLGKFGHLPGETEDTWSLLLRLKNGGIGHLTSTMASPIEFRRGCCLGSDGVVTWDLANGAVSVSTVREPIDRTYSFGPITTVLDVAYFEEINAFVDAVLGKHVWSDSYAVCQISTATLAAAEKSIAGGGWVRVDAEAEPGLEPPLRASLTEAPTAS